MPYLAQCKQCKTQAVVRDCDNVLLAQLGQPPRHTGRCDTLNEQCNGGDPHTAVTCTCCPEAHHHGRAASACVPAVNHPGVQCWDPDGNDGRPTTRPAGCTVCRPLTLTMMAAMTPVAV